MKLNNRISIHSKIFAMFTLMLLIFTSCSNDEPSVEEGEIDNLEYLGQLTRGETSVTYKMDSFKKFTMNCPSPDVDGKWKDVTGLYTVGNIFPAPIQITFHEGRSWSPFEWLDINVGFHKLYFPLAAYRKKTGFSKDFFTAYILDYNSESNELKIDGRTYTKDFLNENAMQITIVRSQKFTNEKNEVYAETRDKHIIHYQRADLSIPDMDNILFYDDEYECCMAILKMLRDEFGEEVNVNKYISSFAVLDNPIYNFDEIEEYLHEKYNRW